jgi:hypothetical protein
MANRPGANAVAALALTIVVQACLFSPSWTDGVKTRGLVLVLVPVPSGQVSYLL